jgi:hypothetical protein
MFRSVYYREAYGLRFSFPDQTCSAARFCIFNNIRLCASVDVEAGASFSLFFKHGSIIPTCARTQPFLLQSSTSKLLRGLQKVDT